MLRLRLLLSQFLYESELFLQCLCCDGDIDSLRYNVVLYFVFFMKVSSIIVFVKVVVKEVFDLEEVIEEDDDG